MVNYFTKVTINGTDVTSYVVSYEVRDSINDEISTAIVIFSNGVSGAVTITAGMAVIITNGGTTSTDETIFRGSAVELRRDGTSYILQCADKLFDLSRILVSTSYDKDVDVQAGVISAIAQDLIQTYGGLTASVTSSGSDFLLTKFILRNDSVLKRLKDLKDLLNWQMYYDPSDDKVHFEPFGTTQYTASALQTGSNIVNVPSWKHDFGKMVNKVTVVGGPQEVETTESGKIGVDPNYTTTSVLLTQIPVSTKVYANTGNPSMLRIGGVLGATNPPDFEYYVDRPRRLIIWNTATYTPGGSDQVKVDYSYLSTITVTGQNDASIAAYGTRASVIHQNTIVNPNDAEKLMQKTLEKFSDPFKSTNVKAVGVFGLRAGMTADVTDTINGELGSFVVRSVTQNYPRPFVDVSLGDEPLPERFSDAEVTKRIEELERNLDSNQSLVLNVRNTTGSARSRLRYLQVETNPIDSGALILGHNAQGVLGNSSYTLGGSAPVQTVTGYIWPDNTYNETFFDTTFRDAGVTTANWDTTAKQLSFTASQIGRSTTFWLDNSTPRSVELTVTFTGSLTFEVSGNGGSTFETVSGVVSGAKVTHTFAASSTAGVQWRFTESAASTATVTQVKVKVIV